MDSSKNQPMPRFDKIPRTQFFLGGSKICAAKIFEDDPEILQFAIDSAIENALPQPLHEEPDIEQCSVGAV